MRANLKKQIRIFCAVFAGALVVIGSFYAVLASDGSGQERAEAEITSLSSRWVSAVANRDPGFVDLLGVGAIEHYERLRDVALHGDVSALNALGPTDQLQALFLRLTVEPGKLQAMSGREILLLAVDQRWIGQDLRRSDELREIIVANDTATGRLYKFGQLDRPDRGRQYFLRENGAWRVDLRGEHERLRLDFEAFAARSGLPPSEAAFFILETRLLRKVTPADFVPPASEQGSGIAVVSKAKVRTDPAHLRVVAVRDSPDDSTLTAITIEDRRESLRSVLSVGDSFGDDEGYRLIRSAGDRAWLERNGAGPVLRLEFGGPPLDQRLRGDEPPGAGLSLLGQAKLGETRQGLMAQWRNVGLRGRPQLLQQVWLVPELTPGRDAMRGLRVRKLVEGSFWHQIGLAEGDLLEKAQGSAIDSMERWQELLRIAETDQEISIVVQRGGRTLTFHTRTVRPRGSAKPA